MDGVALAAFSFLVGVTVAGVMGTLMQIAAGRLLGFIEPFVTNRFVARSLLATLAAGPMMLGNDALVAWRERRVGWPVLLVAVATAILWACATGIVVTEIALRMNRPLG